MTGAGQQEEEGKESDQRRNMAGLKSRGGGVHIISDLKGL